MGFEMVEVLIRDGCKHRKIVSGYPPRNLKSTAESDKYDKDG